MQPASNYAFKYLLCYMYLLNFTFRPSCKLTDIDHYRFFWLDISNYTSIKEKCYSSSKKKKATVINQLLLLVLTSAIVDVNRVDVRTSVSAAARLP